MCAVAMRTALVIACLLAAVPVSAQFTSGSSGVNGSFPPLPDGATTFPATARYLLWNMTTGLIRYCSAYDTARRPQSCTTEVATAQIPGIPPGGLSSGVFHFTNFDVERPQSQVLDIHLVGNSSNAPLTILSQNVIRLGVNAKLQATGLEGDGTTSNVHPSVSLPGGRPGPGGFAGGAGGFPGTPASDGSPGFGPTGGAGGRTGGTLCQAGPVGTAGAGAGASPIGATLTPLVGGSGGGGAASTTACPLGRGNGSSGGGGGGAVLMAATTQIIMAGASAISVKGGAGASSFCGCFESGGGAGGSIRLVAPVLTASGNAQLDLSSGQTFRGAAAAGGLVRIEGDTGQFNITITGQSNGSIVATPGPLTPPNTPILRLTQIGDLTVPETPTGSVDAPDVIFSTPPAGPVTVSLAASNIPLGTTAKVRVTPQVGSFSEVTSSGFEGSAASSTATASVTIPPGFGAITASATFTCDATLCAMLRPEERVGAVVEVIARNGASEAFIVKRDGTRMPLGATTF
jgi:hypothetical protein